MIVFYISEEGMNIEYIIDYIMYTSHNSNANIMYSIMSDIDEDVREKVIKYVLTTPGNTNRAVLRGMLDYREESTAIVGEARVGYAIVG